MRILRPPLRPVVALLVTLLVVLSAVGCDPPPSSLDLPTAAEASGTPGGDSAPATGAPTEAPAEAKEIVKTFGHGDTFRKSTPAPPDPPPSPTPTPRIIREEIHRDGIRTPCFGGLLMSTVFLRWSRDGSAIVFNRDSAIGFGPDSDIVLVRSDGSALRQFPVSGPMTAVDVSPDGTQVVYSTCAYPTRPGYIYTPSTRHETDSEGHPIIVITSVDPNPELLNYDHELVRVNVDGSEPQRLTTNAHFDNYPAWSPDGTHIAFVSDSGVSIMATDGSGVRSVNVGLAGVAFHPPAWSPDGDWLAATGPGRGQQGLAIHVAAADGQGFRRLSNAVSGASWSPDGQRLAFAKPDGAEVALYTIAADGTDAQRVAKVSGWQPRYGDPDPTRAWIGTVAWSPDGSKILFSCRGGICVVSLDGTPVTEAPLPGNTAAWSPDGSRIAILSTDDGPVVQTVAPDGSDVRILVVQNKKGSLQSADDLLQAEIAACGAGTAVPKPEANPDLVRDCETLLELRDTLFGERLVNWGPGTPITQWLGVSVHGAPPRVTGLVLETDGPSTPALARLSHLETLHVEGFVSPIPPELGQLARLRELTLLSTKVVPRFRQLEGPIPPELGQLANLQVLELSSPRFTGPIPPELGQLSQLRKLTVTGSQLTGGVPPELGKLAKLQELVVGGHQLTGPIPPELGQLSQLQQLDVVGDQLTGPIPSELGQLAQLQVLIVVGRKLTGSIPPELGNLTRLRDLVIFGTGVTGPIPGELGQLAKLERLDLRKNQLTGCIPLELQAFHLVDLGLPKCAPA